MLLKSLRALGYLARAHRPEVADCFNRLIPDEVRHPSRPDSEPRGSSLRALTAAALALPGLSAPSAQAAPGDSVSLQYGHYKQSEWQLLDGLKSQYNPLQVDNISGNGFITLSDRWKLGFNYVQDTWSGATPVASAPNALGGNNPIRDGQTITGASPLISGNHTIAYDQALNPYRLDMEAGEYVEDTRLVQTVASASPETRNQGDFRLGYEWDEATVNLGGGVSQEPDYNSAFGSLNGRMDFNRKLTSVNLGLSYNNSDVSAMLNPTYTPYVDSSYYEGKGQIRLDKGPNGIVTETVTGNRQDWSSHLTLTQIINKDLLLESSLGFIRSTGYLGNPYKAVDMVFVDPDNGFDNNGQTLYWGDVFGVIERRPQERNQGIWDIRLAQYVQGLDASFHAGYRFFKDDWGITAHTFDLDWVQPIETWSVTPNFRYYSQDSADFYQPYFLFNHAAPTQPGPYGTQLFDLAGVPLSAYSSDYRLSSYGAISAGLTVTKQLGRAFGFEAGFEYYTHAGSLMMGGTGEGDWADFDYYQFNAAVRIDPSAVTLAASEPDQPHEHHEHHDHRQAHLGMAAPSGVMFAHMLEKAGDAMVGIRFAYSQQQGEMYRGTRRVSDAEIVAQGCGGVECTYTPKDMKMNMYMVNLMYAPTDWLTLMLMPQFMSMDMHLRQLDGAPPPGPDDPHADHGANPYHATGGIGDIDMAAMVRLFEEPGHKLHATVSFTAPTGSIDQRINGNADLDHYGMQLGTGTWSFWPSLTYNGFGGDFSWGAQLSTIIPLETYNDAGFSFGNLFQSTAWGSYQILDWLQGSVRAVYTYQDSIHGQYAEPFEPAGPMDMSQSYGGQFFDVGIGLKAQVLSGDFTGNHFGVEWQQPAYNDYNGYQLERVGTLWASWGLAF